MPRNVRNFWITLDVDGKKTDVATGPRSRDGGFRITILVREDGDICDNAVLIEGKVLSDGSLAVMAGTRRGDNDTTLITTKR